MIYLQEELGDARLRAQQLTQHIKSALDLVEKSSHRDHFFEVAGHLIHGIPDVAFKLGKALDAAALAAAKLDYEEIKQGLKPEKVEELEAALEETRLRYLNRRSNEERMTASLKFRVPVGPTQVKELTKRLQDAGIDAHAGTEHIYGTIDADDGPDAAEKLNAAAKFKIVTPRETFKVFRKANEEPMNPNHAAEVLTHLADEVDATGHVPVAKLARFIGALERGSKTASNQPKRAAAAFRAAATHLTATKNPSRTKLAQGLRRILAESQMDPPVAGAGEEFQKENPKITDEEVKKINEEHEKNKDVVKDKAK